MAGRSRCWGTPNSTRAHLGGHRRPRRAQLGEVLWIVDLNRQSLDRIVPEIAAGRLASMFEAAGWHTITLKYGRRLERAVRARRRPMLRRRIDAMPNEEYQRLLRAERRRSCAIGCPAGRGHREVEKLLARGGGRGTRPRNPRSGGPRPELAPRGLAEADAVTDRPSVIFAYTIKGWRLTTEGHPANHSALLSNEQWEQLARELGADAGRSMGRSTTTPQRRSYAGGRRSG